MLALCFHGLALEWGGRLGESVAALEEATVLGGGIDPPPDKLPVVIGALGAALMDWGERERGLALIEESLAQCHARRKDSFAGLALMRLGHIAQLEGESRDASARFGEALRLMWAAGLAIHFDRALVDLAGLATDRGEIEAAARLLGIVEAVHERTGATNLKWPEVRNKAARVARDSIREEAYASAVAAGRRLPIPDAQAEALALADYLSAAIDPVEVRAVALPAASPMPSASRFGLSSREGEILTLLARRLTDKEIAAELSISPRTVETHVKHVLAKLDASNRREAAAIAARDGLA